MTDIPFDIVGFDLDGTLVDSAQDLANAVNHALGEMGLPLHTLDNIKRFVGNGVRVLMERALKADNAYSEDAMQAAMPLFTDYYSANVCVHTTPYPGAVAALNTLKTRGVRLAICTNKSERFTLPLLEMLGLLPLFDAVVGGDTLGPGILKPQSAPILAMVERAGSGRTVFLGDTSNDIVAAKAAGVASVAVRFGFVDDADSLGADATLAHFDGLVGLLENWPR
ncbi:MAG: HAD-IA family hydrolase [Sphingobium sp.]|nr:HAD-IA family hydrolase [Sphingobium sp.]